MFQASIRKTTYNDAGIPTAISIEDVCGHQHHSVVEADSCVTKLARRRPLKYGEACIVERVDGEKLTNEEIAEIAASYGVNLR